MSKLIDRVLNDSTIEVMKNVVTKNCETMFMLHSEWVESISTHFTESEQIGQCLLQMMICNIRSVMVLFNGFPVSSSLSTLLVDPTSMMPIVRGLYERTYVYHNIFVEPEGPEEKEILLDIWKIKGLLNKHYIHNIPIEFQEAYKEEECNLKEIRNHAEKLLNKLKAEDKAKKAIKKAIQTDKTMMRGFKFDKKDGIIIDFKNESFTDSASKMFGEKMVNLYTLLAAHAHPTFLGTKQFGQLFNNYQDFNSFLLTILNGILLCQAQFVNDFCSVTRMARDIFESFPKDEMDSLRLTYGTIIKFKESC